MLYVSLTCNVNAMELPASATSISPLEHELLKAVNERNSLKTKELMKIGASGNVKGADGRTAVMIATIKGDCSCLLYLLEHADVNVNRADNWGRTHLMLVVINEQVEEIRATMIQAHLKKGADINAQDKEGKTALQWAQDTQKFEVAKLLQAYNTTYSDDKHTSGMKAPITTSRARVSIPSYTVLRKSSSAHF